MDQKAVVVLQAEKDGHVFAFHMPLGAPLGSAYNAAFEVLNEVLSMAQKAADNAKPPKESDEASTQA